MILMDSLWPNSRSEELAQQLADLNSMQIRNIQMQATIRGLQNQAGYDSEARML